jgi:hypothetical protein
MHFERARTLGLNAVSAGVRPRATRFSDASAADNNNTCGRAFGIIHSLNES